MGLFLVGLLLVIIGAILLFAPGSLTRSTAVAALAIGAVFLEVSRADRFASAALIILAVGFAYFINRKPVELREEPDVEEADWDDSLNV